MTVTRLDCPTGQGSDLDCYLLWEGQPTVGGSIPWADPGHESLNVGVSQ